MRTPFVVGNWKLHKTINESLALVTELKNQLGAVKGVAVGVAPVFTAISAVAKRLEGSAIAGVIGTKSFGRIEVAIFTRAPAVFARLMATSFSAIVRE